MAKKLLKSEDLNTINISLKGLPLDNILSIRDEIQKESSDEVINKDLSNFLTSQMKEFSEYQKELLTIQKNLMDGEVKRLGKITIADNDLRINQIKNHLFYYRILINCITNQKDFSDNYGDDTKLDLYVLETGKDPIEDGEFTDSFNVFTEESVKSTAISNIMNYAKKYVE